MDFQEVIKEECTCSCGGECQHEHCQCGCCNCEEEDAIVQDKRGLYPNLPRIEWDVDDFADWD